MWQKPSTQRSPEGQSQLAWQALPLPGLSAGVQ
jgi:hypothetical protein